MEAPGLKLRDNFFFQRLNHSLAIGRHSPILLGCVLVVQTSYFTPNQHRALRFTAQTPKYSLYPKLLTN